MIRLATKESPAIGEVIRGWKYRQEKSSVHRNNATSTEVLKASLSSSLSLVSRASRDRPRCCLCSCESCKLVQSCYKVTSAQREARIDSEAERLATAVTRSSRSRDSLCKPLEAQITQADSIQKAHLFDCGQIVLQLVGGCEYQIGSGSGIVDQMGDITSQGLAD